MNILFYHYGGEPWFGVGYLSAALKKAGHKTNLLLEPPHNMYFKIPFVSRINIKEKLVKQAVKFNPDLIAMTATTFAFPEAKKMASMLKSKKDIPIILGGIHATSVPEHVLKNTDIDIICRGEGDEAIVEVANALEANKSIDNIKNIWVKKEDGTIIKNNVRELIKQLDKLPFPDNTIFEKYNCIQLDYSITTSRGCPYNCSYCCNHYYQQLYKNKGQYTRRRSPENVITELKLTKKKYGITSVYFWDDTFTVNKDWLSEFVKIYSREIGLPFHCLTRPENITQEIIHLLKKAGCSHINIGIESGSEKIRRNVLNRQLTNKQIIEATKLIKKANIKLNVFNMFGIPDETPKEMLETVMLNLQIKPDGIFTSLVTLFPELQLTKYAYSKGLLSAKELENMKSGNTLGIYSGGVKNHPYWTIASNFRALLPIMNHLPKFMRKTLLKRALNKRSLNKFVHILSFFFVDPSRTIFIAKGFVLSLISVMRRK